MIDPGGLTAEEQTAILADRYSQRAEAYDVFWSPVIRPVGERLLSKLQLHEARRVLDVGTGAGALLPAIQRSAPSATILGVDRSLGMLNLAKEKHPGPLAQMDVQDLALPADQFDSAVVAFVLFHLPQPAQSLKEVHRVLKAGGTVGTVTWGAEHAPPANSVWDEELNAVGAQTFELPAVENRSCCDSEGKMTALFEQAGFVSVKAWREAIEHRWPPEDHFEYQMRGTSLLRLQSLSADDRETCFRRVRQRLAGASEEEYSYRGEVVMVTAVKADNAAGVP